MGVKLDRLRQNCFSFPRWISLLFFFSSCSVQNSDLIGLTVLARQHTNTEAAALLYYTDRWALSFCSKMRRSTFEIKLHLFEQNDRSGFKQFTKLFWWVEGNQNSSENKMLTQYEIDASHQCFPLKEVISELKNKYFRFILRLSIKTKHRGV